MTKKSDVTLAWWYGPDTLPRNDGRPVAVGVTHEVQGEIELCKNGLHGSINPLDALKYGRGTFWRTKHSGNVVHGDDKLASSSRTYLKRVTDTDDVLRHFARLCALDVIHLWDAPDVVVRYLRTGDESIRAAAMAAARAAAGDASWESARTAEESAAWDAAWAAAEAAGAASCWAAEDAACGAARAAATRDAAGDASWESARVATRDAQSKRLHRMLIQAAKEQ